MEEKTKNNHSSVVEDHGNGFLFNKSLNDISTQNAIALVEATALTQAKLTQKKEESKYEIDIGVIPVYAKAF